MLKDLFKGDILLFLLRVFLLVVCLACSFDVFFVFVLLFVGFDYVVCVVTDV